MVTVTNTGLFVDHDLLNVCRCYSSSVCVSARPAKGEPQEERALKEIAGIIATLKMRGIGFRTYVRSHKRGKLSVLCPDTVIFHERYFKNAR